MHRIPGLALMAGLLLALAAVAKPAVEDESRERRTDIPAVREAANSLFATVIPDELHANRGLGREIGQLRKALNDPLERRNPELYVAQLLDQMNRVGGLVATRAPTREQLGIRTEERFGTALCHQQGIDDGKSYCDDVQWLSTRSPDFVNIRGEAFWRGSLAVPYGRQMTASFVATYDRTNVAITFAAEAHVVDDLAGSNRRMFVQAVVDGAPVSPTDVVFAVGEHRGVRTFVFTTQVDAGIHTVEMRWKVDERATAFLRDASLLVLMGTGQPSNLGTLVVKTPPSGANVETTGSSWSDIPGMSSYIYVGSSGQLTATMSAEAVVSNDKRIALRAVVDNVPMQPSNVIFAKGGQIQSRSMTFGATGLAPGFHLVEMQWQTELGGTATMGDRSLSLASFPNSNAQPTHPFVSPPSGDSIFALTGGLGPMAGMSVDVWIPANGNGEVAVQFSAELGTTAPDEALVTLSIDGALQHEQTVLATDGTTGAQVKSWVFAAKRLAPGMHTLEIWWEAVNGNAYVGDRSLAIISEVGFIPDLAEAPQFAGGHVNWDGDLIAPIEPLVGSRKVLAVLLDPKRCGDLGDVIGGSPPPVEENCQTKESVPRGKVEAALFGTSGQGGGIVLFEPLNVASYLSAQSNGRFTIRRGGPGVAGWYEGTFGAGMYYNHPGSCINGFDNGGDLLIADAVWQSDGDIDYSAFDVDGDGKLTTEELAIIVVIPRPDGDGSARASLYGSSCAGNTEPMVLDGVQLPREVAKWNTSLNDNLELYQFTTGAHELMHVLRQLDDIYLSTSWATKAGQFSLMGDNRRTTTHLDPWHKLILGWVTPVLVEDDGIVSVRNVAKSDTVHIVPRYHKPGGGEEFFVLENRKKDQGYPYYENGIGESGVAVWHVINDLEGITTSPIGVPEAFWDVLNVDPERPGSTGQMGRKGLRLIRPFDDLEDGKAVWNNDVVDSLWQKGDYALQSGSCFLIVPLGDPFQNKLAWADCAASGVSLEFLDPASESMKVRVTLP